MSRNEREKEHKNKTSNICCSVLHCNQKNNHKQNTRAPELTHARTHSKLLKNVRPYRMCACVNIFFDVFVVCEPREF